MTDELRAKANHIKKAMAAADTGPLVIADYVIDLSRRWEAEYREQAEGLAFGAWLTRELGSQGRNLSFFKRRSEAVRFFGESARRVMHHETAVFALGATPEGQREQILGALTNAYLRNNRCPLTLAQAKPIIQKVLGRRVEARTCLACAEKDLELAKLRELVDRKDLAAE